MDEERSHSRDHRDIRLGEGHLVSVHKDDYPWVTEWDWEFDEQTGLVSRLAWNGERVFLYHELLKKHRHTEQFVALGEDSILTLFQEEDAFGELLALAETYEEVMAGLGYDLPDPVDFLAYALTSAIYLYVDWKHGGKEYALALDPTGATPGKLVSRVRQGDPPYTTLGEFMRGELTGEWTDPEEDGGPEKPQDYVDLAGDVILLTLTALLREYNRDVQEVEDIWEAMVEAGHPLEQLGVHVHHLIQTYPIPPDV